MDSTTTLEPTARTTIGRGRNRAVADRGRLMALLGDALIAHVGVVMGEHPVVLPTAFAVDADGPDAGGTLYLHGSVAAGWLRAAPDATVCVTVTELDGLVAGRSAFHHSMNYRSAVIIGTGRSGRRCVRAPARARPHRRPHDPGAGGDLAGQHAQGACRDRRRRRTPPRGVDEGARRRAGGRAGGCVGRWVGRAHPAPPGGRNPGPRRGRRRGGTRRGGGSRPGPGCPLGSGP
ncbi:pyridoxamine 5'-phosphate oxidase family protein [Nocardioides sp. B-3]|uniref:pyridoxamine 5'-phosphate oxidase family protein n=1 Tax=Nocardioides sp. B-3 TaxID=2895565 RepID=UPI003FA523E6